MVVTKKDLPMSLWKMKIKPAQSRYQQHPNNFDQFQR